MSYALQQTRMEVISKPFRRCKQNYMIQATIEEGGGAQNLLLCKALLK